MHPLPLALLVSVLVPVARGAGNPPCTSSTEVYTVVHGTPVHGCNTCLGAQGPECITGDWSSSAPNPSAPRLAIPKFVPQGAGSHLVQVEINVRWTVCGRYKIENLDPVNGCSNTFQYGARMMFQASAGQGLDALANQIPPQLTSYGTTQIAALSPYDGTTDYRGTSGRVNTLNTLFQQRSAGFAAPALVAAFVADGSGPSTVFFDHEAVLIDTTSGCAPVAVDRDLFAGIELEVRYLTCTPDVSTFCFGTDAICPCGNGRLPDTGCDNAQGSAGVRLVSSGDTALGDVVAHGTGFPAGRSPTVLLLRSSVAPIAPMPFGDGLLCIDGASAFRDAAGSAQGTAWSSPIASPGPGPSIYQLVYRSEPASFCDVWAAFNTSNALRLVWP